MKTNIKFNITNENDKDKISNGPKVIEKETVEVKVEVKSETKTSLEVKEKVTQPQKPIETKTDTKTIVKPATVVNKPNENKSIDTTKTVKAPINETPKKTIDTKPPEANAVNEIAKPTPTKAIIKEETNTKPNIPANKTPITVQELRPAQPAVKTIANEKPKVAAQTPVKTETKAIKTTVNPSKKIEVVKTTKPQETQNKTNQKPIAGPKKVVQNKPKVFSIPKVTPVKKNTVKGKVKTKTETMRILGEGDDYDVLDDDDILALISEGVILDECSGSDDNC